MSEVGQTQPCQYIVDHDHNICGGGPTSLFGWGETYEWRCEQHAPKLRTGNLSTLRDAMADPPQSVRDRMREVAATVQAGLHGGEPRPASVEAWRETATTAYYAWLADETAFHEDQHDAFQGGYRAGYEARQGDIDPGLPECPIDCGSHGCVCSYPKSGQRTNGPCQCKPQALKAAVHWWKGQAKVNHTRAEKTEADCTAALRVTVGQRMEITQLERKVRALEADLAQWRRTAQEHGGEALRQAQNAQRAAQDAIELEDENAALRGAAREFLVAVEITYAHPDPRASGLAAERFHKAQRALADLASDSVAGMPLDDFKAQIERVSAETQAAVRRATESTDPAHVCAYIVDHDRNICGDGPTKLFGWGDTYEWCCERHAPKPPTEARQSEVNGLRFDLRQIRAQQKEDFARAEAAESGWNAAEAAARELKGRVAELETERDQAVHREQIADLSAETWLADLREAAKRAKEIAAERDSWRRTAEEHGVEGLRQAVDAYNAFRGLSGLWWLEQMRDHGTCGPYGWACQPDPDKAVSTVPHSHLLDQLIAAQRAIDAIESALAPDPARAAHEPGEG